MLKEKHDKRLSRAVELMTQIPSEASQYYIAVNKRYTQ